MQKSFFSGSFNLREDNAAVNLKVVGRIAGTDSFGEGNSFETLGELRTRSDNPLNGVSFVVRSKFSEFSSIIQLVDRDVLLFSEDCADWSSRHLLI